MSIYILNIILIFLFGIFFFILAPVKYNKTIFLIITFLQLLLIMGMRFEIGIDYNNYRSTFYLVDNTSFVQLKDLSENSIEIGYLLLNKIVSIFTTDVELMFLVTSFLILFLVYRAVYIHSSIVWLSIYLFSVEAYIASFNITRQYIAVALLFYSYKYIKDKKFIKFLIIVLCASLFHTSVLFFIPIYFILRINFTGIKMLLSIFFGFLLSFFIEPIISLSQKYFYEDYTQMSFGMTFGNVQTVIIALFYFTITIIFKSALLKQNKNNIILINWSFVNLGLSIFSINTWLITRLMPYSSIFFILLIPELAVSIKNKLHKVLIVSIFIILTFIQYYNTIVDPLNKLIPYRSILFL
ncbi:EpsG family protein [Peribacillus frigoritolerans]|uniref:EpsG family protein n=1 Tax=Peribacillus frigoritolerans TaxID=450367 RepID=A0AAJ1QPR2_9BACI|nr:EpsG family protein [Peribacillus frigoritolerans]MDM5285511.1 EpsG family protein [Peribacillus frigoritolerans]